MKYFLIIILVFLSIITNCQEITLPADTIDSTYNKLDMYGIRYKEKMKKVPKLKIDSCVFNILYEIIDNCNMDTSIVKISYGFLFCSKKYENYYSINIMPITTNWFYNINLYGIMELSNRKFYCIGAKPENLFYEPNTDSTEFIYRVRDLKTKEDSLNVPIEMGRFWDLTTGDIEKSVECNNKMFYFIMKPCIETKKKYKKKKE